MLLYGGSLVYGFTGTVTFSGIAAVLLAIVWLALRAPKNKDTDTLPHD